MGWKEVNKRKETKPLTAGRKCGIILLELSCDNPAACSKTEKKFIIINFIMNNGCFIKSKGGQVERVSTVTFKTERMGL